MEELVIGIDLGTTNSCAAVYENDRVKILENKQGGRLTPSVLCLADKNTVVIGELAKKMAVAKPESAVFEIKRLVGRQIDDPYVKNNLRFHPFKVDETCQETTLLLKTGEQVLKKSPAEISSMILQEIKKYVETRLGHPVKKAVITVPAYFNVQQREVTLEAANKAGFTVLKLLNEPTAASFNFYLEKQVKREEYSLVYDLGGGTFDVAVLRVNSGQIDIIGVDGDSHLGGQDLDNLIIDYVCKELLEKFNFDPTEDRRAMRRLHNFCENAKKELSVTPDTNIILDGFVKGEDVVEIPLTKKQFDSMAASIFKKTIDIVEGCLKSCNLQKEKITHIILAGGSTRIPKIQELLKKCFNGKNLNLQVNPDECVAIGAAIQAAMLSKHPSQKITAIQIKDVTPLSLGVKGIGNIMNVVIKRNTPIPVSVTELWSNVYDKQPTISFNIYEGERLNALKNHLLGNLDITNLTPAPPDQCKVTLTMSIDSNGILTVTAKEKYKNNVKDLKVTYTRGHRSDSEVKNTLKDAEEHRREDEEYIQFATKQKYVVEYCVGAIYNFENQNITRPYRDVYELCKTTQKEVEEMKISEMYSLERKMKRLTLLCDPVVKKHKFQFMPEALDD